MSARAHDDSLSLLWEEHMRIAGLDKVLPLIGDGYCTSYYRNPRTIAGVIAARHMPGAI
ncbi:hypothetical protein [Streptomyces sp. NPDC057623]|uniref:hypothetical protein n=1 Tax=Streptomyces sp. NPDC057623 TaxID=3346187 RepID=UPI00369702B3